MADFSLRVWLRVLRRWWRLLTLLDQIAIVLVLLRVAFWILSLTRLHLVLPTFFSLLFFLAAAYLLLRFLAWWRTRLLWSLRNRLIVAYVFIAVVPVLLLLIMTVISAAILYSQLGGYLLWDDLYKRVEMLADAGDHLVVGLSHSTGLPHDPAEDARRAQIDATHQRDLPGLVVDLHANPALFTQIGQPSAKAFSGMVQVGGKLQLFTLRRYETLKGPAVASLAVPVTPALLETVATDLGPINLILVRPAQPGEPQGITYKIGDVGYREGTRIATQKRSLQPPLFFLDSAINGISNRSVIYLGPPQGSGTNRPVLGVFTARPSQLNRRIFSSLGELGDLYLVVFAAVGIVFLLIEIAALVTGVVLTRTITKAVDGLYRATQFVQKRDLTHRVRIEREDQLGELGESFNSMIGSISNLIEEQKQRQKLENELSIAREVQSQLFPRELPQIPGVKLEAICRAARVVSGDYYDFIPLGTTRLAMAVADISGKGISAALLMASLQAALRSQVLSDAGIESTAALVARLNRHLFHNTADDRFATFFYGVYDTVTRTLRYTNAGHLPPLCISDGKVHRLDVGGMVVGVVEDYLYEQGTIQMEPGSLLVGYSDGLIEPENVYGEEFGIPRLQDLATSLRHATPIVVAESLMQAAEEWAGTPEQADDMTVIVARID
ncbi:MAG TPA: PP2C family protein-serine/threonine phosphatase [Candidatus Dormibacteraeota bacterium]|nr:PP2C family protein-serine/threonine phosphatase [Candidatus Dormibacteraeota bacterium]